MMDEQKDWESIQESLSQADSGNTIPFDEADSMIRNKLGFPEK